MSDSHGVPLVHAFTGATEVGAAVAAGSPDALRAALEDHAASVYVRPVLIDEDEPSEPYFFTCAANGWAPLIRVFLELGADPNFTFEGQTALHCACFEGDPATLVALLDAGADVDAADANGATPLHVATEQFTRLDGLSIPARAWGERKRGGRSWAHGPSPRYWTPAPGR